MKLYHFKRLIKKYSVPYQVMTEAEGEWVAGSYQQGKSSTVSSAGAIVPIREQRVNNSGGDYRIGDCEVFTLEPIDLSGDAFILYKGKTYKVMQHPDYSDYADFFAYLGRRVSGFDKSKTDSDNLNR